MSISQLYSITRRSFQTLDAAMNVAGQNVANAQTEGYHRRRITMGAVDHVGRGFYSRAAIGTMATGGGVSVQSYERLHDQLLSGATWQAKSSLGFSDERHRVMSTMESLFPIDSGSLSEQLGNFYNSWSDLSDNPTGTAERQSLFSKTQSLTDSLNRLDGDLHGLLEKTTADLTSGVDQVNSMLKQIADLNVTIAEARNQGTPDFASEDARDQIVGNLSEFLPVTVHESDHEGYVVTVDGMAVVQGVSTSDLKLDLSGPAPAISFGDTGVQFQVGSGDDGRLGSLINVLTTDIPDARNALDELASTLVTQVNTLHAAGYGLDGSTGTDFFDPTSLSAGSIRLSDAVLADSNVIAASGDVNGAGDNSVALAIADLRNAALLNGGRDTTEDFVINLVSNIGGKVAEASSQSAGQALVVDQLQAQASAVSGVSVDEEMSKMIELQQSYSATARVLATVQQMMDTLLSI